MIKLLTQPEVQSSKREPLLDYEAYRAEAEDYLTRIPRAGKKLNDPDWVGEREIEDLWRLTEARAEYGLNLLTLSYSAGIDIKALQDFYPELLDFFEEYALYSEALNKTPEGAKTAGPHIAIRDVEFERANKLLCYAILLGWHQFIPRIMSLIDYNNSAKDGMLERLAGNFVERAQPFPSECTRHLPYYKTLAIFNAPAPMRPELMREYLEDWYDASRREPYYESHALGNLFLGYWSWEAAAITVVLGIDDTGYRSANFYPRDMVEFALQSASADKGVIKKIEPELRAKAGEPCPAAGTWESIGVPVQQAEYTEGALLKDLGSPYGLTVWRRVQA